MWKQGRVAQQFTYCQSFEGAIQGSGANTALFAFVKKGNMYVRMGLSKLESYAEEDTLIVATERSWRWIVIVHHELTPDDLTAVQHVTQIYSVLNMLASYIVAIWPRGFKNLDMWLKREKPHVSDYQLTSNYSRLTFGAR